jgi:ribosomal protein S18 acetylase RimI-like enzyme
MIGSNALRTAELDDAPKIARVHVASWLETYKGILPAAMLAALSVEHRIEAWELILRDPATAPHTAVYVNEVDSQIVGFGACNDQRDEALKLQGLDGEIGAIYVLQSHQRRGIGQALMRAMAADLIHRGFRGVALWVLRENSAARRFYERCAGVVVADREDVRSSTVLAEIAYGWPDLAVLSGSTNTSAAVDGN